MKIHLLLLYIMAFFLVVSCGTTKGAASGTSSGDDATLVASETTGPDDDYDGVPNSEDECPYIYGSGRTGGCPDSDDDGLRDSEDACPDDKGFANLKGCLDRDSDGIIDAEDECPDEYAENLSGCPNKSQDDIDGDGVSNATDECPELAGWFTANGCPDRDGDGVKDNVDACADMFGDAEYNGCPLPKSAVLAALQQFGNPYKIEGIKKQGYYRNIDGRVYDKNDKLISVVGGDIVGQDGSIMTDESNYFIDSEGSIRNTGGKLVQLDEDNYLFIQGIGALNNKPINGSGGGIKIGPSENNGINFDGENSANGEFNPWNNGGTDNGVTEINSNPYNNNQNINPNNGNIFDNPPSPIKPLSPNELADCNRIDLTSLRAAIYFDYNASRAENTSLQQLNRVVDAMRKCASLELQVGGHADSDGSDNYNKLLSEKRAKTVLSYIKGQGISETRLKYNAYGERYPIAKNTTEEGKQKNRRAEIHISRAQ